MTLDTDFIKKYLYALLPSEKEYIKRISERKAKWVPQSRPQWLAFLSRADELFYGGGGGGGKSDLIIGMAGEAHKRSIIFRRLFPNLRALIERSKEIYTAVGDKFNESLHLWRLNNGAMIELAAMQYEKDKKNFQGRPHDLIAVDESPEMSESQVTFVTAWNRSVDPNQRVRVLLTGNPPLDEDGAWIVKRYGAWLNKDHHNPAKAGELRWYATLNGKETEIPTGAMFVHEGEKIYPRSRTFIPALLDDNPFYRSDGGRYRSTLQSLPEDMKAAILYGDFSGSTTAHPWQIIPSAWVRAAQKRWLELGGEDYKPSTPLTAVGIDPSRGGVDKTSLCKRYDNWFAPVISWPGKDITDGAILANYASREIGNEKPGYINIDVSGIGSSGYDHLKPMYEDVSPFNPAEASDYRDKSEKYKMRNCRAEMYWRMRDALDPESGQDLALPDSPTLLADLCSARYSVSSAGVLVEDKQAIIARIGRSPDEGEACMMANFPDSNRGWVRSAA